MVNPACRALAARLAAAGVPDADFDAAQLYRFVTGRDPRLEPADPTPAQADRLAALAARRAAREPLQYILGEWDFLDFTLVVGPGVLCPRADSEVVCETAIELLQAAPVSNRAPAVLDLCAGTGCLGLGIARFVPAAQVTCVENSPAAYRYLQQNTTGRGAANVAPVLADAFAYCAALPAESVDLIVCNPPYLTAGEMAALMPETAHEPPQALAGGADGLDFYRALTAQMPRVLRPGGWLVLEIGAAQAPAVQSLAAATADWKTPPICRKDYGGNDRVVAVQKPAKP